MISNVPYITPADPLPAQSSIIQSAIPQIPSVQATQILPTATPVITSQVPQYAPILSTQVQQPRASGGVRVVPIYDDF